MKELFDERLSQKIRQTFDKHDEPYNAQGWEMMQQKMNAQKSGKVRALLTSLPVKAAAAAILVIGGVFTYKTLQTDFKGNYSTQQQASVTAKKYLQQEGFEGVQVLPPSTNGTHESENMVAAQNNPKTVTSATPQPAVLATPKTRLSTTTTNVNAAKDLIENTEKDKNTYVKRIAANHTNPKGIVTTKPAENVMAYNVEALAMKDAGYEITNPNSGVTLLDQVAVQPVVNSKETQYDNVTVLPKRGKRINFGVMLSSLVNYSDKGEKDNKVNLGGGVLSEVKLGKRFSITSGVLLTRQSLNMRQADNLPTIPTTQSITTNGATESRSLGQRSSVDMQFVGLDIPVNLQYHVSKNPNRGLYVSMGLSSLAYLQESYNHNTVETIAKTYYKGGVGSQLQKVETTNIETNTRSQTAGLSRFDFAKMLNVSVGMKYMVAKSMQILIEPYIKYPLNTLTQEELRFGSAGVNLRCNFNGFSRR
jgi:hypothetical protein